MSSLDLKVTCLNQRILTCQIYTEKEGLRQQQLLAIIPRHHKHYTTLPNSMNNKVQFSPHIQTDPRQHIQARARLYSPGALAAKTLSWHLALETKSTIKGYALGITSNENSQTYGKTSAGNLLDIDENARMKSKRDSSLLQDNFEGSKPSTPYHSFDNLIQRQIICPPVRSRSVLSTFFVKQKTPKLRASAF